MPAPIFVFLSVLSTQVGAAWATDLFHRAGAIGTVSIRVSFAAIVLFLLFRPKLRGMSRTAMLSILLFGLTLGTMNVCFYEALDRVPLGIAITLEFVGPLAVAVAGSRKLLDLVWVALAASGIVLIAPFAGASFNRNGVVLGLAAGACWALYILCSKLVGRNVPGISGLTMAMGIAAIALLPIGIFAAGVELLNWQTLAVGLAVALLSSVIPYSLELQALRRLSTRVFGLLLSTEPVIGAVIGFLFLRQPLGWRGVTAMLLITLATIGSTRMRKV